MQKETTNKGILAEFIFLWKKKRYAKRNHKQRKFGGICFSLKKKKYAKRNHKQKKCGGIYFSLEEENFKRKNPSVLSVLLW